MMATFCEAVQQVSDTLDEISVRHPGSGVGYVCESAESAMRPREGHIFEIEYRYECYV